MSSDEGSIFEKYMFVLRRHRPADGDPRLADFEQRVETARAYCGRKTPIQATPAYGAGRTQEGDRLAHILERHDRLNRGIRRSNALEFRIGSGTGSELAVADVVGHRLYLLRFDPGVLSPGRRSTASWAALPGSCWTASTRTWKRT